MTLTTLAMVGLAFSLDLLLAEPPNAFHPVAWFGRVVSPVDREWPEAWRPRLLGVLVAVAFPLSAAALVGWIVLLAISVHPTVGAVAAAVVLFLSTSLRALLDLTREVVDASAADLETARERVRGLVGRETDALSGADLRSAAIESASENLADGLVATLLPFAALAPLSIPLAAAVAAWVKAVNTLDSMLGYPEKPIGTASARLDDFVMWLPARVAAALLALAAADPASLPRARASARAPSSPNSGWPMATLAGALDVRLEKRGAYVLSPDAAPPTVADGERAIRVVGRAGVLAVALAAVLAVSSPSVAAALEPLARAAVDAIATELEGARSGLEAVLERLSAIASGPRRTDAGVTAR